LAPKTPQSPLSELQTTHCRLRAGIRKLWLVVELLATFQARQNYKNQATNKTAALVTRQYILPLTYVVNGLLMNGILIAINE
jgi:hypothetical protein